MHIGLIIYGSLDTMSGGYLYDRQLVDYLRGQGDSVDVISLPQGPYLSHFTDNLWYRLPSDLDIVIQDELDHPSLIMANMRTHPYPVISLVHNLHSSERRAAWKNIFFRSIERQYLNSVDGFIFNSPTTRDTVYQLVREHRATPSMEKPFMIATPGGDRLGTLTPEQIRTRSLEPGALRMIFLANLTPLKGFHVLLEAIRHVSADFRLDVVGSLTVEPRYAQEMQKHVGDQGLRSKIIFHGILNGEPLAEILRTSQVLVIPSFYEGFGISFLEGMAFGLPSIGTRAGAIPQLVKDEENGFVNDPGDPEALANCLMKLATDRELLTRLSLHALSHFQSQPTWTESAESVRSFLSQILTRPG